MTRLRPREREVMAALDAGSTYAQIADELGIADGTVAIHVRNAALAYGVSGKDAALAAHRATKLACPVCGEAMQEAAPACGFCLAAARPACNDARRGP